MEERLEAKEAQVGGRLANGFRPRRVSLAQRSAAQRSAALRLSLWSQLRALRKERSSLVATLRRLEAEQVGLGCAEQSNAKQHKAATPIRSARVRHCPLFHAHGGGASERCACG
jgi:hypothetical protein